ncbi:MAG: hypothetical protein SFT68_04230, partial [Rickettsiaceae bacterium]|nr:hypothetical protein [Rickettsiaceae bacterium]
FANRVFDYIYSAFSGCYAYIKKISLKIFGEVPGDKTTNVNGLPQGHIPASTAQKSGQDHRKDHKRMGTRGAFAAKILRDRKNDTNMQH